MTALGRLLDKGALERDGGPRAKATIEVPAAWASETALVDVALPKTLACARCDGGGCDGCGRSGALRGPASEAARVVRVRLPRALGEGVAVRIAQPFGGASSIGQLWIEVRPGSAPSASVRRVAGGPVQKQRRRFLPRLVSGLALVVSLLAIVLALLTWAFR